jgi:hypothetical protein
MDGEMTGRELDEHELRAATIVGSILDGVAVPRDVAGAPDGTHDFDVLLPGRCVALEVTRAADKLVLATLARAFAQAYPAPALANTWTLSIQTIGPTPPPVPPIVKESPELLAVFEHHGMTEIDGQLYPGQAPAAVIDASMKLVRLGVARARTSPVGGPPRLFFIGHGGFMADPDAVNRLAAEHTAANADKLLAARADERHLFIWMDPSHPDAELAMHTGPPPEQPPALSDGVDVVWVANPSGHLWRSRPPGDWEELPCPRVEVVIGTGTA